MSPEWSSLFRSFLFARLIMCPCWSPCWSPFEISLCMYTLVYPVQIISGFGPITRRFECSHAAAERINPSIEWTRDPTALQGGACELGPRIALWPRRFILSSSSLVL